MGRRACGGRRAHRGRRDQCPPACGLLQLPRVGQCHGWCVCVCVCVPCDIAVLKSNPHGGSGGWSPLCGVGALRTRRVRRRVAREGPADLALCDVCLSEWITCTEGDSPETSHQPWALGRAGRRESERDRARCSLPKWLQRLAHGEAEAGSLGFHAGLPVGDRCPSTCICHLLFSQVQKAGLEVHLPASSHCSCGMLVSQLVVECPLSQHQSFLFYFRAGGWDMQGKVGGGERY